MLKDITNAQLLERFEIACFRVTNYPRNKDIVKEMARVEREIARRLGVTDEELESIRQK